MPDLAAKASPGGPSGGRPSFLLLGVALVLVFELIGIGRYARPIACATGVDVCAAREVSYYRLVVLDERPWL